MGLSGIDRRLNRGRSVIMLTMPERKQKHDDRSPVSFLVVHVWPARGSDDEVMRMS